MKNCYNCGYALLFALVNLNSFVVLSCSFLISYSALADAFSVLDFEE